MQQKQNGHVPLTQKNHLINYEIIEIACMVKDKYYNLVCPAEVFKLILSSEARNQRQKTETGDRQ